MGLLRLVGGLGRGVAKLFDGRGEDVAPQAEALGGAEDVGAAGALHLFPLVLLGDLVLGSAAVATNSDHKNVLEKQRPDR